MFIAWMKKEKDAGVVKRFVIPVGAIISCLVMVFAAVYAHGITPYLKAKENGEFSFPVLFYFIVFAVIMLLGALVKNPKKKN